MERHVAFNQAPIRHPNSFGRSTISALTFTALVLIPVFAWAIQPLHQVMAILQSQDAQCASSHIVYDMSIRLTGPRTYTERAVIDANSSSNGEFHFETHILSVSNPKIVADNEIYDGTADIHTYNKDKEIEITNLSDSYWNQMRAMEVASGPCFALGRDLSTLSNPALSGSRLAPILTGTASDGSPIKATLDGKRAYLARSILLYDHERPLGVWNLSCPFMLPSGAWVESRASYLPIMQTDANAGINITVETDKCRKTVSSDFNVSLAAPSYIIVDTRLSTMHPAVFMGSSLIQAAKRGGKPLDASTIFTYSRNAFDQQARLLGAEESARRDQSESLKVRRVGIPMIIALTFLTLLAVVLRAFQGKFFSTTTKADGL